MQSDWAVENLQVIRTLMERSAVYRRALGPILLAVGGTGLMAGVLGIFFHLNSARSFVPFWMAVCAVALVISFVVVRRQALKDTEPFWSPPTRRVVQALLPPLFAGFAAGLGSLLFHVSDYLIIWLVIPAWMVLYGCALHSAGFFMPRGFKIFGWAFILCGCGLAAILPSFQEHATYPIGHGLMGVCFGGAHLAYGIYLHFTEKRGNAT